MVGWFYMMTNFKLGVIIPVYDNISAFNFLLEGLSNQYNFSDFYTIIINDNPFKTSIKELCYKYRTNLHIVYIENEKNIGTGLSRNKGLTWCQANNIEYVTFIDSDDFVPPGYIKSLLNIIIRENVDLVVNNFLTFYPHYEYTERGGFNALPFVFAKIYRMSAIGNLRFLNMPLLEDLTFNLMFLDRPRKIYYNEHMSGLYCHYVYKDSLTAKARNSNDYKTSLSYHMLLAIHQYLIHSERSMIENPFIIRYIANNLYILYEEGKIYCPKDIDKFDDLVTKILSDLRVQDIFNNIYLYVEDSPLFCPQYILSRDGRDYQTVTSTNQFHFIDQSLMDFFKKHGFTPHINFDLLKNDRNLYKI